MSLKIFVSYYYSGQTKVYFFDVGQGDSAMINGNHGTKVLIDGGPDFDVSNLLTKFFAFNSCKFNYVFLSHPHADHLNGLLRLFSFCPVNNLVYTPIIYKSSLYDNFKSITNNIKTFYPYYGDIYKLGDYNMYIFWPTEDYISKGNYSKNINNMSTLILLDKGDFEVLFTGDLENEILNRIDYTPIQRLVQNGLDVLKVPHHGSIGSMSTKMYAALKPKVCVISVGAGNSYGHPDPLLLDYLESIKCMVHRTDLEGTIEIFMD